MDGAQFPEDELSELSSQGAVDAVKATCPAADLELGLFFDGTNNNLANTLEGQQFKELTGRSHDQASYNNDASNVAKLYELYITDDQPNDCDGVAKYRESALIDGIGTTTGADDSVLGYAAGWGATGVEQRAREGFGALRRSIQETKARGELKAIKLDVFGFSRGAAAARHFVNCVLRGYSATERIGPGPATPTDRIDAEDLAKIEIRFLGLFDTVVSWGLIANDTNHGNLMIGLPGDAATKIVHITALDEFRENFPLTHAPASAETIWMPGAHADIGGGYPANWQESVEIQSIEVVRGNGRERRPTTPDEIAAVEQLTASDLALRSKLVSEAWILPSDNNALTRKFTPLGSYPYDPYYISRFLTRDMASHRMATASLHIMHQKAIDAGAPLTGAMPASARYSIPDGIIQSLVDRVLAGERLQPNCGDSYPYRRNYVHYSSNWSRAYGFLPMRPRSSEEFPDILPYRRTEYPNGPGR